MLSPRSVCNNSIIGEGAESLAKVVLEHPAMTSFCKIPLASLRENSIEELDLEEKGVGVPGAIVLSSLLPSASALKSLKCAQQPIAIANTSVPIEEKCLPDSPCSCLLREPHDILKPHCILNPAP